MSGLCKQLVCSVRILQVFGSHTLETSKVSWNNGASAVRKPITRKKLHLIRIMPSRIKLSLPVLPKKITNFRRAKWTNKHPRLANKWPKRFINFVPKRKNFQKHSYDPFFKLTGEGGEVAVPLLPRLCENPSLLFEIFNLPIKFLFVAVPNTHELGLFGLLGHIVPFLYVSCQRRGKFNMLIIAYKNTDVNSENKG